MHINPDSGFSSFIYFCQEYPPGTETKFISENSVLILHLPHRVVPKCCFSKNWLCSATVTEPKTWGSNHSCSVAISRSASPLFPSAISFTHSFFHRYAPYLTPISPTINPFHMRPKATPLPPHRTYKLPLRHGERRKTRNNAQKETAQKIHLQLLGSITTNPESRIAHMRWSMHTVSSPYKTIYHA